MIERSLIIIKPDGVQRSLVGEIIRRFENTGLKIIGMKMVWADRKFAEEHYKAHKAKPFFKDVVDFITEGPIVALAVQGVHAVDNVRKLVGSTSPHEAMPGTIRGDFAHLSMKYASEKGSGGKNIIHASGSQKEAEQEIKLWFKKNELHSYKTVHEMHVF
ncbi:nucleoside-diphosphate kinase [Candidatus Woesearchaeota archaeon]|nr:nucleoside-diphosphate kinase [Candidatus Woesearchaeota archaeon]MBI2130381.1 nucleoside-diphosphate kinase [Candidatus Woesearchaeota archaeon]